MADFGMGPSGWLELAPAVADAGIAMPASASEDRRAIVEATNRGTLTGRVFEAATKTPEKVALVIPERGDESLSADKTITFGDFADRIRCLMVGLRDEGFVKGDRMVLAFPVCTDLFALCFAMFANGVGVVIIDRGMTPQKINQSLETANAKGFVSTRAAFSMLARWLLPQTKRIPKKYAAVGKPPAGVQPFSALVGTLDNRAPPYSLEPIQLEPLDGATMALLAPLHASLPTAPRPSRRAAWPHASLVSLLRPQKRSSRSRRAARGGRRAPIAPTDSCWHSTRRSSSSTLPRRATPSSAAFRM
jgi:acyl-CoA synthetase (AMP-forming)/AMP-acid ligase II